MKLYFGLIGGPEDAHGVPGLNYVLEAFVETPGTENPAVAKNQNLLGLFISNEFIKSIFGVFPGLPSGSLVINGVDNVLFLTRKRVENPTLIVTKVYLSKSLIFPN